MTRSEQLRDEIRKEFGSEAAFARILNLRKQVLSHYLLAKRTPPIQVILGMTKVLNHSAEDLIQIFLEARSPNGRKA